MTRANFVPDVDSCGSIPVAGSIVLIGSLANCTDLVPTTQTLTVDAAAAINDTTIDLTSPNDVILRVGAVLHMETAAIEVVVTEKITVTAVATTVSVEPLTAAVTATDTALTWGLLRVLAPSDVSLNSNDATEDRTDVNTLQGSEVLVKTGITMPLTVFNQREDEALHDLVFPSARGGGNIFVYARMNSTRTVYGKCKAFNYNEPGTASSLDKISVDLSWQSPFYEPKLYQYLTAGDQTTFTDDMKLAGLSIVDP